MRATDRARDRSVGRLRRAYVDGALSTETFELRTTRAYRSRTWAELRDLMRDLPSGPRLAVHRAAEWAGGLTRSSTPVEGAAQILRLPRRRTTRILVGRSRSCDYVISDPCVSARHCELVWRDAAWEVRDLDSTNGTYVDGRRTVIAEVHDADVLTLGQTRIVVSE